MMGIIGKIKFYISNGLFLYKFFWQKKNGRVQYNDGFRGEKQDQRQDHGKIREGSGQD